MFPRWLAWLFLAVIAYLIFQASRLPQQAAPQQASVAIPAITEKNYPALAKTLDVERWKREINPDYAAKYHCVPPATAEGLGLKTVNEKPGEGAGAQCSQPVIMQLTVWGRDGKAAYTGEAVFELGSGEIAAGLEMGLLGLPVQGVRTVIVPPALMTRVATKNRHPAALLAALPPHSLAIVTATRLK